MPMPTNFHLSIEKWLEVLDLKEYHDIFKGFYGVEDLLHLNEKNIRDMGLINPAHRARLISNLVTIREKQKYSKQAKVIMASPVYETLSATKVAAPAGVGQPEASVTMEMLKQPWYHGNISREKAERLVVKNGDFLVRDSVSNPGCYVLTLRWDQSAMHVIINRNSSVINGLNYVQFQFESDWFPSLPALINHHRSSRIPVSKATGALLGNPVIRNVLLEYYDSRCRLMRSSPSASPFASPHSSPLIARRRAAQRAGSFDLLLEDEPRHTSLRMTPERNTAELNAKTRCKRTGSEPLLSPLISQPFSFSDAPFDPSAPPKPSRIPTIKHGIESKPHIAIRNKKLYEDDGKDYSDYEQVKSWPSHLPPSEDQVKRQNSTTREPTQDARKAVLVSPKSSTLVASPHSSFDADYDVPKSSEQQAVQSHLDMVPTKLSKCSLTLPPPCPLSAFNIDEHQSEYLTPMNKPLEASAMATMKMILMESPPNLLALHIADLNAHLLLMSEKASLGLNVNCGLELITLPQGRQLRKDILERFKCFSYFTAVLVLICPKLAERARMLALWIQVAHELRSTHGDLYGFSAIMNALNSPQISSLQSTWEVVRSAHSREMDLFSNKLKPLLADLNEAASALPLHNISIPHIIPLVTIMESTFDLDSSSMTSFDLDTVLGHLDIARFIAEKCGMYQATSHRVLKGFRPQREISDLFCTECHLKVLWGCKGAHVAAEERYPKVEQLLQVLAQRAEPSDA